MSAIAKLRAFAKPAEAERAPSPCELCGAPLVEEHAHLLERPTRKLACACAACATLFDGDAGARYVRVERRLRAVTDVAPDDARLCALAAPVSVLALVRSGAGARLLYPGTAGVVEAEVPAGAWEDLERASATVQSLAPETEALVVAPGRLFVASIDVVYELCGAIRRHLEGGGHALDAHLALESRLREALAP